MNFLDWFPSHTRTHHIQHFIFKVLLFSLKTLRLAATFNQASLMSTCLRISSSVYQFSLLIDVSQITRLYFLTCFNERLPCLWGWACCYAGINLKRSKKQPLGGVLREKKGYFACYCFYPGFKKRAQNARTTVLCHRYTIIFRLCSLK